MSSFDIVAASFQDKVRRRAPWQHAVLIGATAGFVAMLATMVGIVSSFAGRWIVVDLINLAEFALASIAFGAGVLTARRASGLSVLGQVLLAFVSGMIAAFFVAALANAALLFNLRAIFIVLSKPLARHLLLDLDPYVGSSELLALGAGLSACGALYMHLPRLGHRILIAGAGAVLGVGLFAELFQLAIARVAWAQPVRRLLFSFDGLTTEGAAVVGMLGILVSAVWQAWSPRARLHIASLPLRQRRRVSGLGWAIVLTLVLAIPLLAGDVFGQIFLMMALFALMGYGLNIELGYAGLLDLGFVAFFAVGAYTIALLTGGNPYALAHLSFWEALPFAVILSVAVGIIFGVPVLNVRGDYLAVATMGLGEIVRIVLVSDMARSRLGGPQGLLNIPKPEIGGWKFDHPVSLFYLTLAACALVWLASRRLRGARLGRAWMSIRDDEDVAKALGIDPVACKLMAYGIGAGFSGIAGAIFAAMLGNIFPQSFELLISINILALLIIGGIGSLPGVALGAALLIGVPEVLREFGEYRYLFYGVTIILMMRLRPQGIVPYKPLEESVAGELAAVPAVERTSSNEEFLTPRSKISATASPHIVAPLLELHQVSKAYGGISAVRNLDLAVNRGAIHSVIGPNGAGKTTLFNAITGFASPVSGRIIFEGSRIDRMPANEIAASGISRTYQNIRLFRNMTVLENVLVGMHLHIRSRWWGAVSNSRFTRREEARAIERAHLLLKFLKLDGYSHRLAATLPYGQQRLLEIGRALATEPKLLLLDEPLAGMTPREATRMMGFIRELRQSFSLSILLIEHQIRIVMEISDFITVLDHGEKICEGPPNYVRRDARVIEAYLGERGATTALANL